MFPCSWPITRAATASGTSSAAGSGSAGLTAYAPALTRSSWTGVVTPCALNAFTSAIRLYRPVRCAASNRSTPRSGGSSATDQACTTRSGSLPSSSSAPTSLRWSSSSSGRSVHTSFVRLYCVPASTLITSPVNARATSPSAVPSRSANSSTGSASGSRSPSSVPTARRHTGAENHSSSGSLPGAVDQADPVPPATAVPGSTQYRTPSKG